MLKGAGLRDRLYAPGEWRPSSDVDLLVPLAAARPAAAALQAAGFRPHYLAEDDPGGGHASTYVREDGLVVDLHLGLTDAPAPPGRAWEVLRPDARTLRLAGTDVLVTGDAGTALVAALHVAHHERRMPIAQEDLRRAVAAFDPATWRRAAAMAAGLGATDAFATGLAVVEEGRPLLELLALRPAATVRQRLEWVEAPWGATVLEQLRTAAGPRARARVAWRAAVPPPRVLRSFSPLARRGRRGLAAAYLVRPVRAAVKLPAAVRALRAARRGG